jgi:hypothetical protein
MANSVNIDAVVANLGAYYQENRNLVFQTMLLDLDNSLANSGIVVLDDVVDEVPLINMSSQSFLKPGHNKSAVTAATNVVSIDSRTLKVEPVVAKIEI